MPFKPNLVTERLWRLAFWIFLGFIGLVLMLAYRGRLPARLGQIPYHDTIGHFVLIGTIGWLAHRALGRRYVRLIRWALPIGPAIVALSTVVEEILQNFPPIAPSA